MKYPTCLPRPLVVLLLVLFWATFATRPPAVDIVLETLATTTHPGLGSFGEENPAADSNGLRLQEIVEHAAAVFADAFEDAHSIEIAYWWDQDLASGGQSIPSQIIEVNGRVTQAAMQFSANSTWFIDDTPSNDSEFDLSQVLFNFGDRALSGAQQTARFTGSPPDFFEVGFNGPVTDPAAQGVSDLLTVVFQEMGHSLGMNAGFSEVTGGGVGEVDDGDYDVASNLVGGASMAMLPRGVAPDPLDHLAGNDAVIATLSNGERTHPSAADDFAIAATMNFVNIDLPR